MAQFNEVYIIDDDRIFVLVTKKMMENISFAQKITIFPNGQEAINHINQLQNITDLPNLIFLDINMPVMDGWEFLDAYSKISSKNKIPIYLVSSSIDQQEIDKSQTYDCINKFISKPINQTILNDVLSDLS